jgi:hypothetical protein
VSPPSETQKAQNHQKKKIANFPTEFIEIAKTQNTMQNKDASLNSISPSSAHQNSQNEECWFV